jgi:putative Holliday junction resolvase
LAIDFGEKRTGLAVCDRDETIASPLGVVQGQSNIVESILTVVREERIEGIVVGLPLNMDDSEGGQAKRVRAFTQTLSRHLTLPIYLQDERLSSFSAEEKLSDLNLSRSQKKRVQDAVAAAQILESFLENRKKD